MRHIALVSTFIAAAFFTIGSYGQQNIPGDKPGTTTATTQNQDVKTSPAADQDNARDKQKNDAPPLIPRTTEEAKAKICQPWTKDERADTFCGFLRDNYSTLQKVCGLAPTWALLHPST